MALYADALRSIINEYGGMPEFPEEELFEKELDRRRLARVLAARQQLVAPTPTLPARGVALRGADLQRLGAREGARAAQLGSVISRAEGARSVEQRKDAYRRAQERAAAEAATQAAARRLLGERAKMVGQVFGGRIAGEVEGIVRNDVVPLVEDEVARRGERKEVKQKPLLTLEDGFSLPPVNRPEFDLGVDRPYSLPQSPQFHLGAEGALSDMYLNF